MATPVSTPVEAPIVAMDISLTDHEPPPTGLVYVAPVPEHREAGPEIAEGDADTVMMVVTVQPAAVYDIIAVPGDMPVTTPVAPSTEATDPLPDVQEPPAVAFVSVSEPPTQMLPAPVMGPGPGVTVTNAVVRQLPME